MFWEPLLSHLLIEIETYAMVLNSIQFKLNIGQQWCGTPATPVPMTDIEECTHTQVQTGTRH
jgi:hypothetical protein